MLNITPQSGANGLTQLLSQMNEAGGFPISVLTDLQGFPIASAITSDEDQNAQSAVVALVQKTATQVRDQLGMAQTDEISMYDTNGRRLVCRPFIANDHEMILAVIIPNRHQSYRRLTNKTVNAIQRQWRL